jgi:hypothetical protein
MPRVGDRSNRLGELLFGAKRNRELILHKPLLTVGAVPFPQQIQRVVELRQILDCAAAMLGIDVVGHLGGDARGEPVDQPVREMSGIENSWGALNRSGSRRSFGGSWSMVASDPRVNAPRPIRAPREMVSGIAIEWS